MKFREFAASSPGSKYAKKNWNCQDSSAKMEFGKIQAVAVADVHGGANYFRSEFGAKLAIQILFEQIKIFCADLHEGESFSDTGIKNLKYNFVQKWRTAVKKDWCERLKILCAVSSGAQVLILQTGDGTCVLLQRDGKFCIPVPPNENNFFNRTPSLCDEDAVLKMRHAVINCEKYSTNAPAAIFLSTRVPDDCFPYYQNEEHLYRLYTDILDNVVKRGFFTFAENEIRTKLLPSLSKKASQDDVSLAYLIDSDIFELKKTFAKIDSRYKMSAPAKSPPPENIATAEQVVKSWSPPKVTKSAENKTVTAFKPPKISKTDSVQKSVTDLQFLPLFQNATPEQDKPPQTLFKRNEVTMAAPVQIPVQVTDNTVAKVVTPAKATFTPTKFEKYNFEKD